MARKQSNLDGLEWSQDGLGWRFGNERTGRVGTVWPLLGAPGGWVWFLPDWEYERPMERAETLEIAKQDCQKAVIDHLKELGRGY